MKIADGSNERLIGPGLEDTMYSADSEGTFHQQCHMVSQQFNSCLYFCLDSSYIESGAVTSCKICLYLTALLCHVGRCHRRCTQCDCCRVVSEIMLFHVIHCAQLLFTQVEELISLKTSAMPIHSASTKLKPCSIKFCEKFRQNIQQTGELTPESIEKMWRTSEVWNRLQIFVARIHEIELDFDDITEDVMEESSVKESGATYPVLQQQENIIPDNKEQPYPIPFTTVAEYEHGADRQLTPKASVPASSLETLPKITMSICPHSVSQSFDLDLYGAGSGSVSASAATDDQQSPTPDFGGYGHVDYGDETDLRAIVGYWEKLKSRYYSEGQDQTSEEIIKQEKGGILLEHKREVTQVSS